jgi:hypothetical protein
MCTHCHIEVLGDMAYKYFSKRGVSLRQLIVCFDIQGLSQGLLQLLAVIVDVLDCSIAR